ncbi:hypothetical protein HanIR_Chr05g0229011 [Helianthus annuus]|nr:hypothetical protein HanIR_Chr05g0229011 [Helianthus annuus]
MNIGLQRLPFLPPPPFATGVWLVEGRRQRRRERRRSRSYPDEFMLWSTLEDMGLVGSRLVVAVRRLGGGPAAAPP